MRVSTLAALAPLLFMACESTPAPLVDATVEASADAAVDVATDYTRPPDVPRAMTEPELAPQRRSCAFRAGAWPAETIGREAPLGEAIPVDHVLVMMMENRSFDHYFGQLRARGVADVEVPPDGWSNPRADGSPAPRYHETTPCTTDTNHGWGGSFRQ